MPDADIGAIADLMYEFAFEYWIEHDAAPQPMEIIRHIAVELRPISMRDNLAALRNMQAAYESDLSDMEYVPY